MCFIHYSFHLKAARHHTRSVPYMPTSQCMCVLVLVYQTSLISSAPGVQETLLYVVLQSHTDQYRTCPHLNVSSVFIIDLCLCAGARLSNVSYILSTRSTRDTTVCSSSITHDQYRTCPHLNVSSVFIIDLCLCVQETLLYVVLQSHTDQYRTCPHLNVSSVFIIDLCLCAGARLSNVSYILSTRSTRDTTVCSSSITHDQYRTCPHLNVSSVFIIDLCLCAGARLSNVSYILSTRSTRDTTVCSSSITHRSVPYMPTSQCIVCIYYWFVFVCWCSSIKRLLYPQHQEYKRHYCM